MKPQPDVFSTKPQDDPNQVRDPAAEQALVMPKQAHKLEAEATFLDSVFKKIVKSDEIDQDEIPENCTQEEIDSMVEWLVLFDAQFKGASVLQNERAKDEKKPFEEKYKARELLETLLKEILDEWAEKSQIFRVAKAVILNKLATNFYDSEEISESFRKNEASLKMWQSVSKGLQERHASCLQDVNNGLAVVLANREVKTEAIPYLEAAEKCYQNIINLCE